MADHHFDAGDLGRARALLEQTIEELAPGDPASRGVEPARPPAHGGRRQLPGSTDCFERALAEVGDHLALRVQILTTLSFLLAPMSATSPPACAAPRTAVTHAERLGEPQLLSQALSMRVLLGALHGEGVDQARLRRALELEDRDAQADIFVRPSLQNAMILAWTGRLDEALPRCDAIRRRCLERGEETEVIAALFYVVIGLVWRGNFADAAIVAEDAMERALQVGGDQPLMWSLTVRATVNAYAGRVDEARRDVAEALAASQRSRSHALRGVATHHPGLPRGVVGQSRSGAAGAGAADLHGARGT